MSTTETKWPTAVELTDLLYDKFTVSTGHGSSEDAIGFAYAVLVQWGTALPRISADGLQPSLDEVMGLAKVFGLEVSSPDALMWLVVTALASWGDTPAPASAPEPVAELDDQQREAVHQAVAEALGGAYDCQRVWEAWGVGTMGPDDFVLVADDSDRVAEIADAAIEAIQAIPLPAPQAGEVEA
jgi:hypothetical protein